MRAEKIINTTAQADVVTACKIIVAQKLDSGPFGNISIRSANGFWINRSERTFAQLSLQDIVEVDLDGNVISGAHKAHPGEFIHREIYKRRPDVQAIVHTHSHNTVIHSLLGCVIEPYTQLGASIYGDQGLYLGFTGPVRDANEGAAIAAALLDHSIVIAKNHGLFACGSDIKAALWDMVIADMSAGIHVEARKIGLNVADSLTEATFTKSRIEVRAMQYEFMWQAYCAGI